MKVSVKIVGCVVLVSANLFGKKLDTSILFNDSANKFAIEQWLQSHESEIAEKNIRNEFGDTPFSDAINRGDSDKIDLFIQYKLDINGTDKKKQILPKKRDKVTFNQSGNTPLHYAVFYGNNLDSVKILEKLLDAGAKIDVRNNAGEMPMHYLSNVQNNERRMTMLQLFLKHGADLNWQGSKGYSLLHYAVEYQQMQWIEKLGKDFRSIMNVALKNDAGVTPYERAIHFSFTDMAYLFKNFPEPFGTYELENSRNDDERTGLILAIIRGDIDFAKKQIDKGDDINAQDKWGNSALHYAVKNRIRQNGKLLAFDLAELLLKNQANFLLKNKKGDAAFHEIIFVERSADQVKMAELFLKSGVDCGMKNKSQKSLYDRAYALGNKKLVTYLKIQKKKSKRKKGLVFGQ